MKQKVCPVCAEKVILADGEEESEILLIGSAPTDDEVYYGRPFVGNTIRIFRKELIKLAKIDLGSTRQVLVECHDKMKKDDCRAVSLSLVEKELKNKKYIILVGAEAVRTFTGLSVQDVNGMDVTDEAYEYQEELLEQYPGIKFFAITSPQTVFKSLGEFRFGLSQLGSWYGEYNG